MKILISLLVLWLSQLAYGAEPRCGTHTEIVGGEVRYACSYKSKRSSTVRRKFQQQNPCPANGLKSCACPGWEADHIVPLCLGGADSIDNMQWLTVERHKIKTKNEVRSCL